MYFKYLFVSIFGGISIGWLYSGYRYYGTINPSKQTHERLIEHTKTRYKK